MACSIVITGVFGLGQPMDKIRVTGTVEDCPSDVEGNSVLVGLSCRSAEGPFQERFASVDHEGKWQAIFPGPVPNCECGSEVFATARCVTVADCAAEPFQGRIRCVDCPSLSFGGSDDVQVIDVQVECDTDGTALVSISFNVVNTTQNLVHVIVNCGPGGTKVSGGAFGFTPGSSGTVQTVCRYNPAVTPNPQPFVEFFDIDFAPQGCPPVPITVGTLPDCAAECPTTVTVEVRDGAGNILDPEAVVCLAPGDYTVRVVAPALIPGIGYAWSRDGVLQPDETGPEFTQTVGAGEEIDLSVAVSIPGCPSPSAPIELKGCILDCDEDLVLEVRNSQGQTVDLEQPCLAAGTYSVQVTSPTGPGWEFHWAIDGVIDPATIAPEHDVDLGAGGSVTVAVTAIGDGCAPKSDEVELTGCGDGGNGGNGGLFGCDGLLIAAISLLILGGILIVIGVCSGSGAVLASGIVAAAAGAVLLLLWAIFCRSFTSCNVLERMRCLLNWLALLAAVLGILLLFIASPACGIAALITGGSWASVAAFLTDVMVTKGCTIGTCFLPNGPATRTFRLRRPRR